MTNLEAEQKALVDFTQEIRFAVVMYGGASLAIYMNGVAQELLRLVRATAPAVETRTSEAESGEPTAALYQDVSGSEAVYRKLGRMLSRGAEPDLAAQDDERAPIRTRFVIDILSGTSAGGINAVFLAKALANNQAMDQLKQMWIEQGDIGVLINDKASDADIQLGPQDPPRSLLNSRRMYYQLLDALQRMDNGAQAGNGQTAGNGTGPNISPFVDELDLFTTATDIWGQPINIRLADAVARERRHLNTFHFRFNSEQIDGTGRNDFTADFNPFLAFAARVTSAHPAPFEPMKLADIDEVLDRHEAYRNVAGYRSDDPRWQMFFEEYLLRPEDNGANQPITHARTATERQQLREVLAEKFRTRPFSDGGVLDNSPFSFAIEKLRFRHTRLPVDRKLIYIEPVPEHPERELPPNRPPDALKNAWLSLSALPSYQFIRDDLQRLLERNRLIERVNRILKGVERDEAARMRKWITKGAGAASENETTAPLTSYEFGQKTVGEMIELMGSAWGGYQRLRVAETTDELVMMIGRAAGFDDQSDEYMAIRYLVRTWRFQNYDAYGTGTKGYLDNEAPTPGVLEQAKASENYFLYQYDLRWRLRRLKFVLSKAEEISCCDQHAMDLLSIASDKEVVESLLTAPMATYSSSDTAESTPWERLQSELRRIKRQISDVLRDLNGARHQLLSRARVYSRPPQSGSNLAASPLESNPLGGAIDKLGITADDLLGILQKSTDHDREKLAEEMLVTRKQEFDSFLESLNNRLKEVMNDAASLIRGTGNPQLPGILEVSDTPPEAMTPEYLARHTLRYFYDNFDRYDMISYPILFATNVGDETDVVEVFRISPEDAKVLVTDEELRRRKLAGTSLGNFGAFFDRDFRTNDMLWGRLDCADRIITALLSSASPQTEAQQAALEQTRRELIEEASRAIIAEELSATDKASLRGLLSAAMAQTKPGADNSQFMVELRKLLEQRSPDLSKMQSFLSTCLDGTDPLQQFVQTNNFDHALPPAMMVRTSARASKVFGKMLEGIAELHRMDKKRVVWITRLAQLFWGLVEVAVPDSIPNLIFRHWLKLLYFFETLLVVGGTLLLNQTIQQFGFLAFGLTVTIHIVVLLLADAMAEPDEAGTGPPDVGTTGKKRKRRLLSVLKTSGFVLIIFLTILGALMLAAIFGADSLWPLIQAVAQPTQVSQVATQAAPPALALPANANYFRIGIRWAMVAVVVIVFLGSISKDVKALFKRK